MANVSLSPYPYTAEQEALDRKRKLALLLQQESSQPIQEPSVPGANASPFQGVAKMVQALIGNYQNHKLDEQQKGLDTKIQTERIGRAQDMANALIGKPPDSSVTVPMAPTQAMPVPSTLTPEDLQATQLPGGTPYSSPTPPPQTPEGARTITAPNVQGQEKAAGLRNLLAQSLASPDPAQQQFGQMVAAKSLTEGDEQQKQAFQLLLKQMELEASKNKPSSVGSGGLYIPGQGIVGAQSHNIDPLSAQGMKAQLELHSQLPRNIDPNSAQAIAARLQAEQTLKATPGAPPQPQAPMSPERLKQEQDLIASREAAQAQRAQDAADRQQAIQQSRAPDQVKVGVSKAFQAKDMINNVRDAVKAKPYLLGPVAGRLEQTSQGVGTTFGFQNQSDEQDAATLAGNIGNLLIAELQLTSPGRTSAQLLPEIKHFSAQIKDNPSMLEGFLKGTENRANVVVKDGQRWGINPGGKAAAPAPGAPRNRTFNPATGKLE